MDKDTAVIAMLRTEHIEQETDSIVRMSYSCHERARKHALAWTPFMYIALLLWLHGRVQDQQLIRSSIGYTYSLWHIIMFHQEQHNDLACRGRPPLENIRLDKV